MPDQIPSGDVHGPVAIAAFNDAGAAYQGDIHTRVEQSVANLTERGVAGELLDALAGIMESTQIATSHATTAAQHVRGHLEIGDRIASDPGLAGTQSGHYFDPSLN